MTTAQLNGTTHVPAAATRSGPPTWTPKLPARRRERRPAALAAGAVLLLVCGAVGGNLALQADDTVAVLTLARPVGAGQQLTAADLRVAHLAGSGVHALAASAAGTVQGQTLNTSLPAGTLLTGAMLARTPVPGPGQEVLAMALKPGAFPSSLAAGAFVGVLRVPAANTAASGVSASAQVLVPRARVLDVRADAGTASTVVSLLVDVPDGPTVAAAAAAGAVTLAMLPSSR